jgi:hypothetical protein
MKTPHALLLVLALTACATERPQKTATEAPNAAPAPVVSGPDVITEATCVDDVWLLTHYELDRLASGSSPGPDTGYPLECCAKGVLTDDQSWRCELDWPSSDMVDCSLFQGYHDALATAHPEGDRPPLVQSNLDGLKRLVAEAQRCAR